LLASKQPDGYDLNGDKLEERYLAHLLAPFRKQKSWVQGKNFFSI